MSRRQRLLATASFLGRENKFRLTKKKCSHMWELGGGLFSEFFPPFPFFFWRHVTAATRRRGTVKVRRREGEGDSSLGPQQAGDTSSPGSAPSLLLLGRRRRRRHHARGGTMGGKRKGGIHQHLKGGLSKQKSPLCSGDVYCHIDKVTFKDLWWKSPPCPSFWARRRRRPA